MRSALVLAMLFAPSSAFAERPTAWLFRATPGFGYGWDDNGMCPVGRGTMLGGWHIGKFVTPSLMVGGSLTIGIGAVDDSACPIPSRIDSDVHMTFSAVIGPGIDWYPLDRGFHVRADAGYGEIEIERVTAHGVGGSLAIGYDWRADEVRGEDLRLGLALQATALRTTGHATFVPSLVMTIGVD